MHENALVVLLNGKPVDIHNFTKEFVKTMGFGKDDPYNILTEQLLQSLLYYVSSNENIKTSGGCFQAAYELLLNNTVDKLCTIICGNDENQSRASVEFMKFYSNSFGLNYAGKVAKNLLVSWNRTMNKINAELSDAEA